jgi:hypothetical protein
MNDTHSSSLSLLSERAGGERRQDRHLETSLSVPKPRLLPSVLPPRSGLSGALTRDQIDSWRLAFKTEFLPV